MLDGRSCVVPRMFSSSCQTENNWSYMKDYLLDLDIKNGKRPMEIDAEGEPQPRKCTKMLDSCQEVEIARVLFRQQSLQGKDSVVPQMDSEQDNQLDGDSMDSDVQQLLHAEIFLSASDQNQQQHQAGDSSDSGSLLPRMNRDSSIACLSRCSRSDYGSLASLNRSFQNIIRSGELYKWRRLNDIIEHWIYFSCALLEWEAYDPNRQRWMHLPRMASNGCFMFSDKESLAVGTELLVFGRELRSHVIYRYSLLTNSWSSGMRMNFPRCLFGSASLGEIAILAGGCDSEGHILDSAELYNSESQTWETLPNMIKPRKM